MKLAIIGSRSFEDYDLLSSTIKNMFPKLSDITCIVSGGAIGADSLAVVFAKEYNITPIVFKPNYTKYGRKLAPMMRNSTIVENSDFVVAFWDSKSPGTLDAITKAKKLKKRVVVIHYTLENTF